MVIGQKVLSNVRFGRVLLSMRSCVSCLRRKKEWQYSLRFQEGGMRLGMGVGFKGLMNPL